MKTCITSNQQVSQGYVEFVCPSCQKEKIVRSAWARKNEKPYTCPSCGFEGP